MTLLRLKRDYSDIPVDLRERELTAEWDQLGSNAHSQLIGNLTASNQSRIDQVISNNCVLYFPHNRFEEPAWLNETNLKSRANIMETVRTTNYTNPKLIHYSPMHDNQDWVYSILFDRTVLTDPTADSIYDIALNLLRLLMSEQSGTRFGIDLRNNRRISVDFNQGQIVPSIFQLSSGETLLLNFFLSVLRDFDLSAATFVSADEIRGIVVIDEIDLHLHVVHQHDILPRLLRMFPKVQFIVTTHSPLFVLEMAKAFGKDGFAVYRLPQGDQISAEEFSEFGEAYRAFAQTSQFSDDVRRALEGTQHPVLFMEGTTDLKYLRKAAELLGQSQTLEAIELQDGRGGEMKHTWNVVSNLTDSALPQKVLLLHDCDYMGETQHTGRRLRRTIPMQDSHPISRGIENLFSKARLEKAIDHKFALIDVKGEQQGRERGIEWTTPAQSAVNKDEKNNLCGWLCENGTTEDFQHFQVIFDLLEELLLNGQTT